MKSITCQGIYLGLILSVSASDLAARTVEALKCEPSTFRAHGGENETTRRCEDYPRECTFEGFTVALDKLEDHGLEYHYEYRTQDTFSRT